MDTFHDRINELYEEARDQNYRIGRKKFAEMCGVRRWQMHGWLNRTGSPNAATLRQVAKACKVSVSWLVGETDVRRLTHSAVSAELLNLIEEVPSEALDEVRDFLAYLLSKYKK